MQRPYNPASRNSDRHKPISTPAFRPKWHTVVASTGTTLPARVTPAGDATQAAELHAQFAAITEPAAQTAFWRKLTPEQQALILKRQA